MAYFLAEFGIFSLFASVFIILFARAKSYPLTTSKYTAFITDRANLKAEPSSRKFNHLAAFSFLLTPVRCDKQVYYFGYAKQTQNVSSSQVGCLALTYIEGSPTS